MISVDLLIDPNENTHTHHKTHTHTITLNYAHELSPIHTSTFLHSIQYVQTTLFPRKHIISYHSYRCGNACMYACKGLPRYLFFNVLVMF